MDLVTVRDISLFCLEMAGDYFSTRHRSVEWLRGLNNGYSKEYLSKTLPNNKWTVVEGDNLRLLDVGREKLFNEFPLLRWRGMKWDGLWRVVIYDIPEKNRNKRDKLRKWLKRFGFAQWQISVWVSPHQVGRSVDEFFRSTGLADCCGIYESRRLSGQSDRKFASELWKLEQLNGQYAEILGSFNPMKEREYLELLAKDPMLPKGLEPEGWLWEEVMKKILDKK